MAHWLSNDRIDSWIPGSVGASLECQSAVRLAMRDGKRKEFNPWLDRFGNGVANPMVSQAPNQVGLGGGCALLQDPNQAYVWSSQMAPLLKRQMHHYRTGLDPIPLGRFGDHPVVGVCALQDNGLNHCRSLDVPLYNNLYTGPTGKYRFPSDVSLFDASLPGGCPSYSLPGIGKYPG